MIKAALGAVVLGFLALAWGWGSGQFADPFNDVSLIVTDDPDQIEGPGGPVGGEYLVSMPIEDVGEPPSTGASCVGRAEWARDLGAADASTSNVRAAVTNGGESTLRISGVRLVIDDRASPGVGTVLGCPGGGGPSILRTVVVDLDSESLSIVDQDGATIPADFTLQSGEVEVFDVVASTESCDCRWHVELTVEIDGQQETLSIDDGGAPFRTTAISNARRYEYLQGRWVDVSISEDASEPLFTPIPHDPDAGETCRHLPPEAVADAVGEGWTQAEGSGAVIDTLGPGGSAMTVESCDYHPPVAGLATGVQILRAADDGQAQSEYDAMVAQFELTGGEPTDIDLELTGDARRVASGLGLVRCGNALVLVQAPDDGVMLQLLPGVVASVDPACS